jgi:hypothetical protein
VFFFGVGGAGVYLFISHRPMFTCLFPLFALLCVQRQLTSGNNMVVRVNIITNDKLIPTVPRKNDPATFELLSLACIFAYNAHQQKKEGRK